MSEKPADPTPDADKPQEFKISVQLTESMDGTLGFQVLGQAVKLSDVRKVLQWALTRINDEITVELVKNVMDEKVKANGFRKLSLTGLFNGRR